MSLRCCRWQKYITRAILSIIIATIAVSLAKVAIWEKSYYNAKTEEPRPSGTTVDPRIEAEVTPGERDSYTVAADKPRYLSIEKLSLAKARIVEVGVTKSGELDTPVSIFDVGWYRSSSKPGSGGTLLLDGHNGGPTKAGVFKQLPSLQSGDKIILERGDGTVLTYQVFDNRTLPLTEASDFMSEAQISPQPGAESLTIISCTGEWSDTQKTFLSRQFLRAILTASSKPDSNLN